MKMNIVIFIVEILIVIGATIFAFIDAQENGFSPTTMAVLLPTLLGVIAIVKTAPSSVKNLFMTPTYSGSRMSDRKTFNFKMNDGVFDVGSGEYLFKTRWSSLSENSINLRSSDLSAVVLAEGLHEFSQVNDAKALIESVSPSMDTRVHEGEFVVAENKRGHYACIRVVDVKFKGRGGDKADEVTIEWTINPDRMTNFYG